MSRPPIPEDGRVVPLSTDLRPAGPTAHEARVAELGALLTPFSELGPPRRAQWLLRDWLTKGGLSVVYGAPGTGKSFLALDMAAHVATDFDWHGARVAEETGAEDAFGGIYLAAEGEAGYAARWEAHKRRHPDVAAEVAYAPKKFQILPTALDLSGDDDAAALVDMLGERGLRPEIVVIDTLARSMGGRDENSSRDMGQVVASCDLIRNRTGAHVMLVHHEGKDGDRGARGSTVLRGAADTEIHVTAKDGVVTATCTKQKDGRDRHSIRFRLTEVTVGTEINGDPITSAILEPLAPAGGASERPALPAPDAPMSPQKARALACLGDALKAEGGTDLSPVQPPDSVAVPLKAWQHAFAASERAEGNTSGNIRSAFSKIRKDFENKGIIAVRDGFVWRAST